MHADLMTLSAHTISSSSEADLYAQTDREAVSAPGLWWAREG